MNPVFSIITPCLNAGVYLGECLASVQEGGASVEHLVVDGGSTDGSLEVLRRQVEASWTSEPDAGQTDAINKGLARARGMILGYLCADDLLEPDSLRKVGRAFDGGADVVYGDAYFLEGYSGWKRLKRAGPFSYNRLRRGNFLLQPSVFFRRQIYERYGPLDATLQFCMDHEYWLRIGRDTAWTYLPEPLATCRLHPGAKTSRALAQAWEEAARMQSRHGITWRPRLEALWMRLAGAQLYRIRRRLLRAVGRMRT
jgi:glycosyltransferase involved in cell wall biosynthesis